MKQWDLFEIFNAREDNYTNMLQYLFETEASFRTEFLKLIFGKDVLDVKFETRAAYRQNNTTRYVPDIILYNDNNFAIIEVKIYSGEGDQQTKRYFEASRDIMNNLGVINCSKPKFFFLTIDGAKPQSEQFQSLCWSDIANCMNPEAYCNVMAKLLTSHFKERIKSIEQREIDFNGLWEKEVHSYLWSGASRFYVALEHLFKLIAKEEWCRESNIIWRGYSWTSFNKSSNSLEHSATFYPEDGRWQGADLKDAMKCNKPESCYDYHFEFKWNEAANLLNMRLDYHLNPYKSAKDIENIDDVRLKKFAKECNEVRKNNAIKNKDNWFRISPEEYHSNYNKHITDSLMTLVTVKYEHDELKYLTVDEVLKSICPFIEVGTKFIAEYFLSGTKNS